MPYRKQPIVPGQIYHVFNRSIAKQPIFLNEKDYQRFLDTIDFYRFTSTRLRFSFFNRLNIKEKETFLHKLITEGEKQLVIFAFCLMPNHFHFLLRGLTEEGIKKFTANLQNSYAKYFNTKRKRSGALFQEMFRAVRVESDEQFIHVSRYIHLNPYSSFIIRNLDQLKTYPWSSLIDYLGDFNFSFLDKNLLNSFFPTISKLETFIFDQADYQRHLEEIKHLAIE